MNNEPKVTTTPAVTDDEQRRPAGDAEFVPEHQLSVVDHRVSDVVPRQSSGDVSGHALVLKLGRVYTDLVMVGRVMVMVADRHSIQQ